MINEWLISRHHCCEKWTLLHSFCHILGPPNWFLHRGPTNALLKNPRRYWTFHPFPMPPEPTFSRSHLSTFRNSLMTLPHQGANPSSAAAAPSCCHRQLHATRSQYAEIRPTCSPLSDSPSCASSPGAAEPSSSAPSSPPPSRPPSTSTSPTHDAPGKVSAPPHTE